MPRSARAQFSVVADLPDQYAGAPRHFHVIIRPFQYAEWAACNTGGRFLRKTKIAVAAETPPACLRLPLPPFQARRASSRSGVSVGASARSGELSRSDNSFDTREEADAQIFRLIAVFRA